MKIDLTNVGNYKWNGYCVKDGMIQVAVILGLPEKLNTEVTFFNFADNMLPDDAEKLLLKLVKSETLNDFAKPILISTHNVTLISNDILRPDCYFIYDDVKDECIPFHMLTDKELRFEHNIEKMYRAGCFDIEI